MAPQVRMDEPVGQETFSPTEPSVSRLVGGIIDDAQTLFKQQTELLKVEIRKDLRDATEAGFSLGLGGALLGVGAVFLLFMLVHLLNWLFHPNLPLWGSFAIVGALVTLAGGIVFYRGRTQLENLNPLPEQTAEGLKENLQWKTNPS